LPVAAATEIQVREMTGDSARTPRGKTRDSARTHRVKTLVIRRLAGLARCWKMQTCPHPNPYWKRYAVTIQLKLFTVSRKQKTGINNLGQSTWT
jgi:hypothetical protein